MWGGGLTKTIPPQRVLPLQLESPLSLRRSVHIFLPGCVMSLEEPTLGFDVTLEESASELFQTNPRSTPRRLLVCRQQLCGC